MVESYIRPIEFKLLLEGKIVPFGEFSIEQGVNNQSIMNINIPFSLMGISIRPRTHVALFYRYADVKDMPFLLLFSGDISAIYYNKTNDHRRIDLECRSYSSYLNFSYLLNTGEQNAVDITTTIQKSAIAGQGTSIMASSPFQTVLSQLMTSGVSSYIYGTLTKYIESRQLPRVMHNKYKSIGIFDPTDQARTKIAVLPNVILDSFINSLGTADFGIDQFIKSFVDHINAQWMPLDNFWQHFYKLINLFMMEYIENCGVTAPSFIYKPNYYFGTPPRCNVIFPCQYRALSYSNAFLSAPTRMIYDSNAIIGKLDTQTGIFSLSDISPLELSQAIHSVIGDKGNYADKFKLFSAEEAEKGIIPYFGSEQQLDLLWFKSLLLSQSDNAKHLLQGWMDYKLFQLKMAASRLDLGDCSFMPQLLIGFPAVIIDSHTIYTGYVNKIIHYGSATGRAGTRLGLSYVKNILELTSGFPWWINNLIGTEIGPGSQYDAYTFNHIGEMIYQPYFGCDSIKRTDKEIEDAKKAFSDAYPDKSALFDENMVGMFTPPDIRNNDSNIFKSYVPAQKLQQKIYLSVMTTLFEYYSSKSQLSYADEYTFRKVSSFKDYVKYYGKFVKVIDETAPISDLEILEPGVQDKDSDGNNYRRFFLSRPTRRIIDLYEQSLNKVMADSDIYKLK